jgi:hypothetical protein
MSEDATENDRNGAPTAQSHKDIASLLARAVLRVFSRRRRGTTCPSADTKPSLVSVNQRSNVGCQNRC